MVNIGVDIRILDFQRAGVGNYAYNLAKGLGKVAKGVHKIYLFQNSPVDYVDETKVVQKYIARIPLGFKGEQVLLTSKTFLKGISLFHSTFHVQPFVRLCKSILTIHDLAFEYFPECYPKESLSYFKRWIPRAVHNTDRIIAVSENTKSDLVRLYNIRPEKIKVIHNGINMKIMKITTEERLWRRLEDLRIPKQYILTLSTLEPRKNIPVLLKAFQLLKEKHRIEHKLVIGGGGGWLYAKVFEAVRGLELENDVVFTGYVSNEDLPYIYSGASLFVYPSLYEGFGFPPLEAMQCGVPTICSNTSSLPEVVGDGAITFDPKDPKDLAKKILDLLTDTALRTTLSLKGIKRAKRFTWERTVKETYDLYLEVLDSE